MESKNSPVPQFPMPLRGILLLTGMYSFSWSAFFRYFGDSFLRWLSMGETQDFAISAKTMGVTGMVLGFLIFLAAFYPISWRYLILIGIIGLLGLASWYLAVYIPLVGWNKRSIFHLIFNQLLWLIPLTIIFFRAQKVYRYLKDNTEE